MEREKHLETRFGLFGNAYPTELKSGFSYAREIWLLAFFFLLRDVEKIGGGDADTDRRGKRKTASFFRRVNTHRLRTPVLENSEMYILEDTTMFPRQRGRMGLGTGWPPWGLLRC